MFEEENVETAANVEETDVETTTEVEQPTSPVEEVVDQTKAFATRLKEEKSKAKDEVRNEIASSFGYASWDEYIKAQTNNKLIDKGLDPEEVRPVLEDLIKNDPEYISAMKYKKEAEELEKKIFASTSLQDLNNTFGTAFKDVNELDAETLKMWNEGTPLVKAFAANNWNKIQEIAVQKASSKDNGKSHLKTIVSSAEPKQSEVVITADQIKAFKAFGFSEEQAKEYLNRTKK